MRLTQDYSKGELRIIFSKEEVDILVKNDNTFVLSAESLKDGVNAIQYCLHKVMENLPKKVKNQLSYITPEEPKKD
jgi:hypothetical protein